MTTLELDQHSDDCELSIAAEQALAFTQAYTNSYVQSHTSEESGLDELNACRLAAGRLEWLLGEARSKMSELFTREDMRVLMSCFQDAMFSSPDQFRNIAGALCDDLGIEVDEWEKSSTAPLIRKLVRLSQVELVTLGDVIERAWDEMKNHDDYSDTLAAVGLKLAD